MDAGRIRIIVVTSWIQGLGALGSSFNTFDHQSAHHGEKASTPKPY